MEVLNFFRTGIKQKHEFCWDELTRDQFYLPYNHCENSYYFSTRLLILNLNQTFEALIFSVTFNFMYHGLRHCNDISCHYTKMKVASE